MSATSSFNDVHRETSPEGGSSKKWVTFDDLIDDAMESGKLSPRRNSRFDQMKRSQTFSSSQQKPQQQPPVILPPPPPVEKRRNSLCLSSSASSSDGCSAGTSPTNVSSEVSAKRPLDFSQSMGNPTEDFQVKDTFYLLMCKEIFCSTVLS